MSKVAKAALGLMVGTIIAKILGFGRELVLASIYGTSVYSDIYITAMNIPIVIFASIGSAMATTFIPMYFTVKQNDGNDEALKFTNNIFNIVIILCILLGIIGLIFTEQIVKLFAIGFKGEILVIAVKFTKILIVGIVFTGLSYIMTAYLQINENFIIPGLISIPKNIIIIISMILSIKFGPFTMVWGTLIGMGSEFLFQYPYVKKYGYKYKFYININDKYLKKTLYLLGPIFIGIAVNQVNTMIDRTLASTLIEGSISALNYANKLNQFVQGLFIISITSVIYPILSKLSSEKNKQKFIETIVTSVNSVMILVIPISVGAIVLSKPIVELLFQRGEFNGDATIMTSQALIMYAIGMFAVGLRDILGKVFYALQDTKTPAINGSISVIMNIILNLILVRYLKHLGLALATSISSIICILLLFRKLKFKLDDFGQKEIISASIKTVISSVIMGIVVNNMYSILITKVQPTFIMKLIVLAGVILLGGLIYLLLIYALRVKEVDLLVNSLKRKNELVA